MSAVRLSEWYATFARPAPVPGDSSDPAWQNLPSSEKVILAILIAVLLVSILFGIIRFFANFFDPGER